jgi:hypothetical protein
VRIPQLCTLGLLPAANVIVIHSAVVPPITFSKRLIAEVSEISVAGLVSSRFGTFRTFVSLILIISWNLDYKDIWLISKSIYYVFHRTRRKSMFSNMS